MSEKDFTTKTGLAKYDAARKALMEAKSIDEVKQIKDKSEALRHYAKQSKDIDMANWAAEIRIRAERRMGEMLKEQNESGEMAKPSGNNQHVKVDRSHDVTVPTLADVGITKMESSRAQKIASVPEAEFEAVISDHKEQAKELTSATIQKLVSKNKVDERRADISEQEADIKGNSLPILENKYHVISIDPPWPYEGGKENTFDPDARRVANPYPEMSIDDIKNIQIPANDDCVMWLWTTHRFLPDAFDILKEWGFEYKATMVWNKQKIGMGHWLRMQCEFCLLAVKGRPVWDNTTVRDVIDSPRREHSRKPDEFFEMVNGICVGAKLEYFSRENRDGWDTFGNDTEKF